MVNFAVKDSESETEEGKTAEIKNGGEQQNGEAGEGVESEGEGVRERDFEQGTEGVITELGSEEESLSKGSE